MMSVCIGSYRWRDFQSRYLHTASSHVCACVRMEEPQGVLCRSQQRRGVAEET